MRRNKDREDNMQREGKVRPASPAGVITKIHQRLPLPLKMVCITVLVGLIMWVGYDIIQTRILKGIFQERLNDRLAKQAMDDRLRFDRYVKAHLHSAKLFVSQRNFSNYIEMQMWPSDKEIEIKKYRRSPAWFPGSSILRTFIQPRFALLLDANGEVREIYGRLTADNLPGDLLKPTQRLLMKSIGQNYITSLDEKPYLIASDYYVDDHGGKKAVLMLASPIDDVFLTAATGSSEEGHIVALISAGIEPEIVVSSDTAEMTAGTPLNMLSNYLVTGQEVFDYGAAEQVVKLVSFISLKEVDALIQSITSSERRLRIIGLPILIGSFALLMYWITWRIQLLTRRVTDFSERTLGVHARDKKKGDQLYILEDRFQHLTEEVLQARDVIKKEAEERLLFEKKDMEVRQKVKQLKLLQSVTQAVGVGVIKVVGTQLISANKQMEQFADICGGLSNFHIEGVGDLECCLKDNEGVKRIFLISCPDIFEGEKILLVQDVTKIKEQTAALEYLAMHDTLTDLPNRALLQDRLQYGVYVSEREKRPLALLMMDLNRFKEINDTLGHHVGDMVLQAVGRRLPEVLRKSDTIARLGGDEFAVVLPATDAEQADQIARKLLRALEQSFEIEGHNLYIGASIGMVTFPEHGNDASTLMQRADVAMYVAKHDQCGLAIYHPDLDQHSIAQLMLMNDLRCAVENEELELYFQPKIECCNRRVCGVEVLIRWNHPQRGMIPPDAFITLAEANGLMKSLTLWVLSTGLKQYQKWRGQGTGINFSISINLSTRNLHDPQFPRAVEDFLKEWDVKPESLEFEITESAVMADPDQALRVLNELDDIGVLLSIDDFGTGYSSLAYLKKLPVDEIKIDKSFVMNMVSDDSDAMIVRSTIDLAHNLGLNVIAEGVESREVLQILNELGCDKAQGYYICRPVPADRFIAWLHDSGFIINDSIIKQIPDGTVDIHKPSEDIEGDIPISS